MKTTHPKIRPDTAPLLDLSPHRRREEYDEDSWLRVIGGALLLTALGLIVIVLVMAL